MVIYEGHRSVKGEYLYNQVDKNQPPHKYISTIIKHISVIIKMYLV